MNKRILFAFICILTISAGPFGASAQGTTTSTFHRTSKTGFDHLMPCRNPRPAAKTTADNAARVIGLTFLNWNGSAYVPLDSSSLIYGTGRGSWYSQNGFAAVNFDMATSYTYVGSSYNNDMRSTQTFDASNNILSYTEQAWINWIANWRNDYQELYTYDAMRNVLTNTSQGWDTTTLMWINSNRTTNTYTAANKLATSVQESWNNTTSAWENGYRTTNAYDASNFPLNSVSEVWSSTMTTWDSAYRITYTADASGNIITELAQQYDMTFHTWINASRYTYTRDASNHLLTELYEVWDFPTAVWVNSSMTLYSAYTGDNAGTIVYQNWDNSTSAFVNNNRDNYAYNSFNQPTFVYNETWAPSTSSWIRMANANFAQAYYYETYISTLPHIPGINGTVSVYPVPAKDALSINVTWDEPQAFTVSIADMMGRTVHSWKVNETDQYATTLPVKDFASGNYIIKMQGTGSSLIRRFVVER
jgi:hypothetical protein